MKRTRINLAKPQPLLQLSEFQNPISSFSQIITPQGLNFEGKASIGPQGIQFSDKTYTIQISDFEIEKVLGSGQFGIVSKVIHKPTSQTMALKQIRVELDQHKLNHIIMELEILHKSKSGHIIDFFGAFVNEGIVYVCLEYMDASLDKPISGLSYLKEELGVMHRDIKPTNVLMNRKGECKLADFGISGTLILSMAKTNVGCEPYMAPERITGTKYTSKADIWSLGLSLVEMATGVFPYQKVMKESVFAQLNAVLHGTTPRLPDSYSTEAQNFVSKCLEKRPEDRPTFSELLSSEWFGMALDVDMAAWVQQRLNK